MPPPRQLGFPHFGNPFSKNWPWKAYWAFNLAQFTARYGTMARRYRTQDYIDFVIMATAMRAGRITQPLQGATKGKVQEIT